MVKRFLLSMTLLLVTLSSAVMAQTTVTVGNGTTSGRTAPFNHYYNNGTAAMVYDATNFDAACDISSIAFEVSSAITKSCSLHIYVGTKTASSFETLSDWPSVESLTEVYANEEAVIGKAVGWETYEFTTPYSYDPANGNLVVVVCRQSNSYSSTNAYKYTSTTNAVLYKCSDGDATTGVLASVVNGSGSRSGDLPNAQFNLVYTGAVCNRPATAPVASNITSASADIAWGAAEGVGTYQYVLVAAGTTPDWSAASTTAATTVQLTDLSANTAYDFYVRSYCDEATQSAALSVSFRTECVAVAALPWSEGFENETAEAMPSCWSTVAAGPKVYANSSYSTYSHSGNNCLYVYAGSTYYDEQYIVFPTFDFALNTAQLQLWHKEGYATASYVAAEIGVMSDPNDPSTFVFLAELEKTTSYTYFDLNIEADAAHNYLAIHIPATGYDMAYYFDDIALVQKPTCLRPEHIAVTDEDFTTAVLRWESDSELGDSVLVKNGDEVLYNVFVQGDSLLLENLTPATIYSLTVSVMGVCSDTDHSAVKTVTVNFQTACNVVASFPWLETFENGSNGSNFVQACWTNEHISGPGSYLFQYASGGEEGNALKLPDMNATTYTLLTLPEFNIPADGKTYEFQLSVNRNGSGSTKQHEGVNVIYNNDQDTLFIPRYVGVKGSVGTVEATGWYTYSVQLSAGMNTIKILGVCEYGNATYLDNFRVGKPVTCFKGSNIHVVSDATTSSSATIAWDAPELGAAQYKVTVKVGDSIYVDNALTDTTLYEIENLTRDTDYSLNVSVVSVCGDDDESDPLTKTVSVTTLPTCYKPSAIHVVDSLATTTSATIVWTAPEQGAAQYRVNITMGADTLVNNVLTADTFCVIENLAHSSSYKLNVSIKSVCGEEDESRALTTTVLVKTLCSTITEFPWSENFENYASGTSANDINCFSTFDLVGNANDWEINGTGHNSNRSLYCRYTGSSLGRTVGAVELPEMLLEEGKPYVFNYWLEGSNSGSSDTITVYVGETILHTFVSATDLGSTWNEFNDTIMGTGEVVRFGFTFSNLDGYFVYLDDVTVDHIYKNVTFLNYDSTELQSGPAAVGYVPVYEGETPVKPATAQYTYTFTGWDTELAVVTEDAVYTAQFDSVVNEYLIVFQNYDGTVLQSSNVAYGEQAAYTGETPVKPATAQYTYTFTGWDAEPALVEAAATYTAQYDSVVNTYVVTFKDWDATVLKADTVAYGAAATAPADPVREGYVFTGWDADFSNVVADLTVTAQYQSTVGFENTNAVDATKAVKFFKDGQIYIRRGEELYDATGRKVE